jgi:hypothetical protein
MLGGGEGGMRANALHPKKNTENSKSSIKSGT